MSKRSITEQIKLNDAFIYLFSIETDMVYIHIREAFANFFFIVFFTPLTFIVIDCNTFYTICMYTICMYTSIYVYICIFNILQKQQNLTVIGRSH